MRCEACRQRATPSKCSRQNLHFRSVYLTGKLAKLMEKDTRIQLVMLYGEGLLFLISSAFLYLLISRQAGAELLGQYSLALAWMAIFQSLGNLGLPEFIMREVARSCDGQNKYINHGLIIGLCSSVIAMMFMASVVVFFGYTRELTIALLLGTFTLTPVMATSICRSGFLAQMKTEWILLIGFIETLIIVAINAIMIMNGYGVIFLILTIIGAKILSSLLSLYFLNKNTIKLRLEFDAKFCKQLLPPIFTFALSNSLGLVSKNMNSIMLSIWGTISVVGVYAAASKIMDVTVLVIGMFAQLMLPQIARSFASQKNYNLTSHYKMLYTFFGLAIPLGIGVCFFSKPIVEALFGQQFSGTIIILRILMLYVLIDSADTVLAIILKAAGRQKADVCIYVINPIANFGLSILLIPIWGGAGSALSKLGGVLCSFAFRYVYTWRQLVRVSWLRIAAKPILVSTVLVACLAPLINTVPGVFMGIIYISASGLLLYLIAPQDNAV